MLAGELGAVIIRGDGIEVNYASQVGTVDDRGDRNEIRRSSTT